MSWRVKTKDELEPSVSETQTTKTQEGEAETVETTPKPMYRPESELSQGGSAFVPL